MTAKVLVVGNGPSKTNYEFINNFDGTVLCVDMVGKEIMEHGRVPDYVLFSEINEGVIKYTDQTLPKEYIGKDITIIHLSSMKKTVIKMMDDMGLKHETFLPQYTTSHQATGNVGLYSVAYADLILHADEIHIIGLDYKGPDHIGRDWSKVWIWDAKHYVGTRKLNNIIDHSGGNFPTDVDPEDPHVKYDLKEY